MRRIGTLEAGALVGRLSYNASVGRYAVRSYEPGLAADLLVAQETETRNAMQQDPQHEKRGPTTLSGAWLSVGIGIGIAVGAVIGAVAGNVAIWACSGVSFGVAIGVALSYLAGRQQQE
jgi:hypothetical protein